ncbi:MAG: amino acid permease [Gemmatimonadetes bacterium]|nr:amino acid permease [Gemmatimonadota bacterium]
MALAVGGPIGAGIFRTPGLVVRELPYESWAYAAWILGGGLAFLAALSVAELGARLPRAGGPYAFIREAYGPLPGFLIGWLDLLAVYGGGVALLAVAFGEFVLGPTSAQPPVLAAIAVSVIVFLALVQTAGLRTGSTLQNVVALAKVGALLGVVAICFAVGGSDAPSSPAVARTELSSPRGLRLIGAAAVALQGVFFTYHGWADVTRLAEEIREPERRLPRLLLWGTISLTAIYVAVNAAFLRVLPIERVGDSKLPAADALQAAIGGRGARVIMLVALVAIFGTLNALLMYAPRLAFAMARDGLMPRPFGLVNRGGTPWVGLWSVAGFATLLAATGTVEEIIALVTITVWAVYALMVGALLVLRRRSPAAAIAYRTPGYPWVPAAFLLFAMPFLIATVVTSPAQTAITVGVAAFGGLLYRALVRPVSPPAAGPGS